MTLALMTVLVMQGGLLSELTPRAGLLVEGVGEAVAAPTLPDLEAMTLEQLEAERVRVEAELPSLLLPALSFVVAGCVFVAGAATFLFVSLVVGGILFAISAPLIVVGIVTTIMVTPGRSAGARRLKEIRRLTVLRQQQEAPPAVAPPPPPPPGVERMVEPGWLLAAF